MEHARRFDGWELVGEDCETVIAPGHLPYPTFTRKALVYYAGFIGRSEARDCLWGHLPVEDAHHVWLMRYDGINGYDNYFYWQTEPRSGWTRATVLCLQGQSVPAVANTPERCVICEQWEWAEDPHFHEYGPPKPDPLWNRLVDKRVYG